MALEAAFFPVMVEMHDDHHWQVSSRRPHCVEINALAMIASERTKCKMECANILHVMLEICLEKPGHFHGIFEFKIDQISGR